MQTGLRLLCVAPALFALLTLGCSGKNKATEPEGGNPPRRGALPRGQRPVSQASMKNIGEFYRSFREEHRRPPKDLAEFLASFGRDEISQQVASPLEGGLVVMVFPANPSPKTVIAYEKELYGEANDRVVLFADGSVKLMNDADFQAALKGN